MAEFKITEELILSFEELVRSKNDAELKMMLQDQHHADIAEVLDSIELQAAIYIFKILDSEKTAEVLLELEDGLREDILANLSSKEIAEEINELDTDDATDIISELPKEKKQEVISELLDTEHAKDIVELLRYDEDTAGGLMGKELIKVNENWNVLTCVKEMREQAENVSRVHTIYVVDDDNKLKGRLSLKDLLTTSVRTPIKDVFLKRVDSVRVDAKDVEVARMMQKYDLNSVPVVDELGHLVGRITIDDVVDVIKEEADKDYQLAAGISQDVDSDDTILDLARARLPWLILALFGGLISVAVLGGFEGALAKYKELFYFTPLIAAMAGNVGVQSSAIIIQGLANDAIHGSLIKRLSKELFLSLLNGFVLSTLLFFGAFFLLGVSPYIGLTITLSLLLVIIMAALIGTFIPIVLDRYGIDPALATGPFITTSNDILGILLFFTIAKTFLGF
ncbi:MAG: magnesium transporter [Flavobacteriales bacterium]|nr:magnesium transporter [Flavobacteriales bacterium]